MSTENTLPTKVNGDVELQPLTTSIYVDSSAFEHARRMAGMLMKSELVPEAYRKSPQDIMIALDLASRLGISPVFLMQRMSVIKGKPVIEGQLVIALINERGPFKDPLEFTFTGEGDNRECTCTGVRRINGKICETKVGVKMAKAAGWWSKNPLWAAITDQMLSYRSAMFLARVHCPEVTAGMSLREEVVDVGGTAQDLKKVSALQARLSEKKEA